METKSPIKSKTVNANILATAILFALDHFGIKLTPEMVGVVYAVGNVGLRFISRSPIAFGAKGSDDKIVLLYKGYKQLKKEIDELKSEKQK